MSMVEEERDNLRAAASFLRNQLRFFVEDRDRTVAELVANRDRWHRRAMIERRKAEVYKQALDAARHRAAVAVVEKHDLTDDVIAGCITQGKAERQAFLERTAGMRIGATVQGPADADVYFDPDGIEVGS